MFKRFLMLSLVFMFAFALVGCGDTEETEAPPAPPAEEVEKPAANEPEEEAEPEAKYADGIYYAEDELFDGGWKYTATIEVKDGKITTAEWNGVNIEGGKDKLTLSADGEYPMVAKGGAQAEWYEQAQKAADYLVETQDPTMINYTTDEGHTDDIAGVSIHVVEFFDLAEQAMANGPVAAGPYKDGFYYAQEAEFAKGFKYMAHIAVKNGSIVAVDFNAIGEGEEAPDKDAFSRSGEYGMKAGGASSEWHEQADLSEEYLLQTQDPTKIAYTTDEGNTDDIAGVTMKVKAFFTLAEQALANAK